MPNWNTLVVGPPGIKSQSPTLNCTVLFSCALRILAFIMFAMDIEYQMYREYFPEDCLGK